MRKSLSLLVAALAVAVAAQASSQAIAQSAPASNAGVTTTLTGQQQKKNAAPVRAVARPVAPVRSVSRPAPVTRSVSRPAPVTRSVSRPVATTRSVSRPVTTTRSVSHPTTKTMTSTKQPIGTKSGLTAGPVGKTKTGLTAGPVGKTKTGLTAGPVGKTKTGLTTGPVGKTKTGLTAGPVGKTKTGLTAGPGSKIKTGLTAGPGSKIKTGLTAGPGSKIKTGLTAGPGSRTKTGLIKGPGSRTKTGLISGPGRNKVGFDRSDRRRVVINRDRRRFFVNNRWRTLIPLIALGTFAVGYETYYADGYVPLEEPVCSGFSEDGSRLRWMAVPTEDGGSEYQCVAYSTQRNRTVTEIVVPSGPVAEEAPPAPPAETTGVGPANEPAAVADVPPAPATGCELLIYSESNFQGLSSPVDENQASLEEEGWKNEIASIQIKSGTWDFYSDEDFGGEMMRLGAGTYPTLDPKWSKHIGSFMCSAPAK
jgi:hypothetical protein